MRLPLGVLPTSYADAIVASGAKSGALDFLVDQAEDVAVVNGFRVDGVRSRGGSDWLKRHYSRHSSPVPNSGTFYRVRPMLHLLGEQAAKRGAVLKLGAFCDHVEGGGHHVGTGGSSFTLAYSLDPGGGQPLWSGWHLTDDSARWWPVQVVHEERDLLAPLAGVWPLDELAGLRVMVVGAGSIGSAAAEALAAYGVRHFDLVDPERLLEHNFARHRVSPSELGRWKVSALADRLTDRDPAVEVTSYAIDVIDDADVVRGLLSEVSALLVTADGVAPRRVANHLAVRAGVPAVFACVLEDGALGEVVRVRPRGSGCLSCLRENLRDAGGLDPESGLDLGYGTGSRHRPMTAVGGDLDLVAGLGAKSVVATLLERGGHFEHRLPGDHAILGLRPLSRVAPPFDRVLAGEVRWREIGPPREDCPSCATP